MFTIHNSDYLINQTNCLYPHKIEVIDVDSLKKAVAKDYVCAFYKGNYRSNDNFIGSDCLTLDCDNDHSDDESEWVDVADIKDVFKGVTFAVHYSRNHQRDKGTKKARPRFHILFPIEYIKDATKYSALKKKVLDAFPYFDKNAKDAARFFFGTENPNVELIKGGITVDEFIAETELDALDNKQIIEGNRNSTMSRYAGIIIKRYGDTEVAYDAFIDISNRCVPLLEESELKTIWSSAQKFYKKIVADGSYIPPEKYNDDNSYKPGDYSDVGQAEVLTKYFSTELRYSPQTHFLRYRGNYWQESQPGAQYIAQELTRRQLLEARQNFITASKVAKDTGASELVKTTPKSKQKNIISPVQANAIKTLHEAKIYLEFAINRRSSSSINSTLKESHPMLEIDFTELDADPFLLCTPKATYELRKGVAGAREHKSDDFITKMTAYSPSLKGKDLWDETLIKIFGSPELIDYVQMICGLAVIGKVYVEALIIAYGDGGNGKSTFWNSISRVLGMYSGNLSADALTVNNRRNVKPEMAELRGKRLIMSAESQQGARLNDSIVKQLCSTDAIFAEKKYKDPFSYIPSHTLILYTNHLPKVSATDDGIWRRLIVIPFNNKLTGTGDVKNFSDTLIEQSGEYIMYWIIEGAKNIIANKFNLIAPQVVTDAINEYKDQNDWMKQFLDDRCVIDKKEKESSSELYKKYIEYCSSNKEYTRSTADFSAELEKNGFRRLIERRRRYIVGLRLKKPHETDEIEDLLG